MEKVFVDTNVILDFVLSREGEQYAMDLFQLSEDGKYEIYVSFLTMANVAYVARKHRTREELYEYLRELSSLFRILSMDETQFTEALTTIVPDFEDLLQYVCASNNNCDCIVTNNLRDYTFSEIPVYTPAQFLSQTSVTSL